MCVTNAMTLSSMFAVYRSCTIAVFHCRVLHAPITDTKSCTLMHWCVGASESCVHGGSCKGGGGVGGGGSVAARSDHEESVTGTGRRNRTAREHAVHRGEGRNAGWKAVGREAEVSVASCSPVSVARGRHAVFRQLEI